MNPDATSARGAVLHVAPPLGGGVDRHIRDIARAGGRRHLLWHAGETAEAIEMPAERKVFALDPAALEASAWTGWLRAQGVGLIHAHAVGDAVRRRVEAASRALGVPYVATLHDVLFVTPRGLEAGVPLAPDETWLARTAPFLARAAARIAPSGYIADLVLRHLPGQSIDVIPNGSPARIPISRPLAPRPEYAARAKGPAAIVLGAIGPHKGARVLEEAARLLAGSEIAIVVVGYVDAQVDPGWRGERLFVHGAYDDADVAALVAAYGGRVALFPNQVPESFSYALSDLWAAGLPAIVPPDGALGARVARHGGGWLLPAGFGAAEVAALLRRLLAPEGAPEVEAVESALLRDDPDRIPSLDAMTRSLDALYARFGIDPAGPVDPASEPARELLAKNLDGALFRQELARVADELAQVKAGLAAERQAAERFATEARAWIAKLEGDVAAVQADLVRESAELAVHRRALESLPKLLRRYLLRRARNANG